MAKRPQQIINTVEGNTAPPIVLTAQRQNSIINLSGCTADLLIWNGSTQTNVGHTSCVVTSAVSGVVTYTRQAGDIPTAGNYFCDLKITYGDTTFEILWQVLKLVVGKKSGSST